MTFSRTTHRDFLLLLLPFFALTPTFGAATSHVGYALEWHSGRQTVSYIFSGTITQLGRPCPNARVELQLFTPGQEIVRQTTSNEAGVYEIALQAEGTQGGSAEWKLVAQPTETAGSAAEIGGRTVFTDLDRVVVVRTIQIHEG